jgi:hypothetical protein
MKNVLILLILFVCTERMKAQNAENIFNKSVQTQSNHIIDVGLISAGYTYEHSLGKHYTISGGAGITGFVGYSSSSFMFDERWQYSFHPYISIEPRYYYDLDKRMQKGKNTDGNAGSFFAVQCNYIFKAIKKHNIFQTNPVYGISPYWGLRRIWWNHLLFEFRAGLAFGFNSYSDSKFGITLGVRFGYKF